MCVPKVVLTYFLLYANCLVGYTRRLIICILGRQPELGLAELRALFDNIQVPAQGFALVDTPALDVQKLGGTQKAGRVITILSTTDPREIERYLLSEYANKLANSSGKTTLGISFYNSRVQVGAISKLGLALKNRVKKSGKSVRLIPNKDPALNTATSHHNKLGLSDNKIELLIISTGRSTIIAESIGAQNITALARRDQQRPARDAFVGMLPPKLALMMVNMAVGSEKPHATILDPFCGTGVVPQEALLLGYTVYASDLSDKMVDYTKRNLDWLRHDGTVKDIQQADATSYTWAEASMLDAVVCETYLGQPFSAPPSPAKLQEVRRLCQHICSSFLTNIAAQITTGTRLCVAVPAWRGKDGNFTRLSVGAVAHDAGLTVQNTESLLYYREDQVVARDIYILEK